MARCDSSCSYYGVDENYNGYCKKDFNSRRERGANCNLDENGKRINFTPDKCNSGCPYYGVDYNYNGYCKKDSNSRRERDSKCKLI